MKNNCHCQEDWYEPEKCKNGTCEFFHCDNCWKNSKNMAKKGFQEAFFCGGLNGCQHMLGRSSEKDNSIKQRLEKLSKGDQEKLSGWMGIIDDLLHARAEKIKVQTDKIRQEERTLCAEIVKRFDNGCGCSEYCRNRCDFAKEAREKILNPKNDE